MDPPLTSTELRAFEPVLRMGCPTNMMQFYKMKWEGYYTPHVDSFELLKCYSKCWEDMNRTEEAKKLYDEYKTCMDKNMYEFAKCRNLRRNLEEVAVKHRFGEIPVMEKVRGIYYEAKSCIDSRKTEDWHECKHFIPTDEHEKLHFYSIAETEDVFNLLELPPKDPPKITWTGALQHP